MPTKKPKMLVVLNHDFIELLDNYRRQCKQIPSISKAIRSLLDEAIKKHERRVKK